MMSVSLLSVLGGEVRRARTQTISQSDFNGIELSVWEKKNPDRREGVTIELVSRCGMNERHGELFICDDEASQK